MLNFLSVSQSRFAPRLLDLRKIAPFAAALTAYGADFDLSWIEMALLKSFAMLVGPTPGAPPAKRGRTLSTPGRTTESHYAYYRRCQQFRRDGGQCKAPAMKGEPICHRHAEQADMERRRAEQRRELLSRPGAGLGSFRAIQRTIGELAGALLSDSIDGKAAGRLMVEIQAAIRLRKILTAEARRRGGVRLKPVFRGRSLNAGAESPMSQSGQAFAAINGRSSTREGCCSRRDGCSSTREEATRRRAA